MTRPDRAVEDGVIDEKYRDFVAYAESGIGAVRNTGVRFVECRDRYVRLMMPLAGNTNHIGTMYAGCIFTLGEMAGGAIFGASFDFTRLFPIVKEETIRYRRPVMTDITLQASLTEERVREIEDCVAEKGKCDFVLDLEIADTQGEIVALVHGTWQVRTIPPGLANPLAKPR
jgi:thioesterase domain-containing protein